MDGRLAVVTVREIVREPAAVLDRVARGERLIVARHGRPVATLQPLDGVVVQPLTGREFDVGGSPLGDAEAELAKLSDLERRLLRDAGKWDRIQPMRVIAHAGPGELEPALDRLAVRGLARKTSRGWIYTGRGMVLREILLRRGGRGERSTWHIRGKPRQLSLHEGDLID